MTVELDPDRRTRYVGKLIWPLSAVVSLCGTTSSVLTLLTGVDRLLYEVRVGFGMFLGLFFVAAVWMSLLYGLPLLLSGRLEEIGTLILRGRPVPAPAWRAALTICYLAPWIALGALCASYL